MRKNKYYKIYERCTNKDEYLRTLCICHEYDEYLIEKLKKYLISLKKYDVANTGYPFSSKDDLERCNIEVQIIAKDLSEMLGVEYDD